MDDRTLRMTRRSFVRSSAAAIGMMSAPAFVGCMSAAKRPTWRAGDPFQLGVAAGTPSADGFVLWTRLAPEPLCADPARPGGMSGGPVPVEYEVASSPDFRNILRSGIGVADPEFAYSVHVELTGLDPGRTYWYRFMSGDALSRAGCAVTAPSPGALVDRLRFGFVSCSNYEHGYFSAYRHLADEHPDLVLFLGDYIYEYLDSRPGTVRRHSDDSVARDLRTYRNRYAQYRQDPDLQRLHAEATALLTWDDHEVQNDYANEWSQTFDTPEAFLVRRAAAYQAFYEHMPLRRRSRPSGPSLRLYDQLDWGGLAQIFVLDGRQYRSREACYGPPNRGGGHLETDASCPERLEPGRSLLGAAQEEWLYDGLTQSRARWNLLAQDVPMARLRRGKPGQSEYWTDGWDGYPANRMRLLRHIHESRVSNPVVLSGDIHSFWANDLKADFDDPGSATVATEFVGTSISSHGVPYQEFLGFLPDNPHVRYFDSRSRGYAFVELTPEKLTTRFEAVDDATDPRSASSTLETFVVESGRPGPQLA